MRIETVPCYFDTPTEYTYHNKDVPKYGRHVGYIVAHVPSGAVYFGVTEDPTAIYTNWYQRLAYVSRGIGVKGVDNLSASFRAVYTRRIDFAFHVLEAFASRREAIEWQRHSIIDTRSRRGMNKVLNMDRSIRARDFWMMQAPADERDWRFGTLNKGVVAKAARQRADAQRRREQHAADVVQARAEGSLVQSWIDKIAPGGLPPVPVRPSMQPDTVHGATEQGEVMKDRLTKML